MGIVLIVDVVLLSPHTSHTYNQYGSWGLTHGLTQVARRLLTLYPLVTTRQRGDMGQAPRMSAVDIITATFVPRAYQRPILKARANGVRRGVSIIHRRGGKDLTMLNMLWVEAMKRVGLYNYYFPTYSLGKKIVWKGMDKEGKPFLSYIPTELVRDKNETELRLEFINGSILQIVGTENINQSLIGINPIGCVFSEFAVQNPLAWELTRPILAENGGWAWFVYTPRGRNHGYTLFQMARDNPKDWFCQQLSIKDTSLPDGSPVVSEEFIQKEVYQGMDPDLAQQEYYCSFDAPMQGSYYGRLLTALYSAGRVAPVAYTPGFPVTTSWDIGIGDQTAIWFAQVVGDDVRLIDYYENTGEGFDHYLKVVCEKPYTYDVMFMPHDLEKSEWGTGRSLAEMVVQAFAARGIRVEIVPKLSLDEGITAVRRLFPRLRIDTDNGNRKFRGHAALDCLASYHKQWNDDRLEYEDKPYHDWASHCADSLRYLALGFRNRYPVKQVVTIKTAWNPMVDVQADEYEDSALAFNPMTDFEERHATF